VRIVKFYLIIQENSDEGYLIHSFKSKPIEPVEMTEIPPKKVDSGKAINVINLNETTTNILKIDTDTITKKFFNGSFQDLTLSDHQKMYNQFYEILKLVDEFKKENSSLITNSSIRSKTSIFNSEELKYPFPNEK